MTRRGLPVLSRLLAGLFIAALASIVDAQPPLHRALTASEKEFVRLCDELYAAFEKFQARAEELRSNPEAAALHAEEDPSAEFVRQFIEFERRNRGTHAGLMAVRRLVLLGGGGGELENPRDVGRRHALDSLPAYTKAPELPEIMRFLDGGNFEPQVAVLLQQLIDAPEVTDVNRAFAKYMLAQWALVTRDVSRRWEQRIRELDAGSPPQYSKERAYVSGSLAKVPTAEAMAKLELDAIRFLESLSESEPTFQQPGVIGIDERWFVIDFSPEKTKSMPSIRQLATGLLFKERHLRVGSQAPELALQLISNKPWSLASQSGRVVIIQFSFKGCGPCEAMYPDLAALREKYHDKVVVLSIMADEKLEDTTTAVNTGKMSWDVCWDGFRGPVATKWSVSSFPTVYVIGPDGKVAARNLRGQLLKSRVDELVSSLAQ